MSDRIPRDRQGRWHGRRELGSRGPTRMPAHPRMPLPEEVAAPEGFGRQPSDDGVDGRDGASSPPPGCPNPPADPAE
ncbi:hypothetical protein [Kitasatospora sp. NPDC005856]|uniref:hypothetical protein n=1 Tax=Kitasatospora sp. NPDC005856 TaxID=3154566 RepID=UPI0033D6C623